MNGLLSGTGVAAGALAATALAAIVARARRERATARRVAEVLSVHRLRGPVPEQDLLLPEPVTRYLRYAGVHEQLVAGAVEMDEVGEFRLSPESAWRPFQAIHYMNPGGPAFLWRAGIQFLPGVSILVEDSYCDGVGRLDARLGGLIPLARQENDSTLAAGELHRYLAELVWNPAAFLPGNGVRWDPIDRDSARASLTVNGITVSLDFLFDSEGRLIKAYARRRFRDVDGKAVPTPWLCEYGEYVRLNEVLVPREGEVSWYMPEGMFSYCRLQVRSIRSLSLRRSSPSLQAG